jgi:alkanesulfonate monooxygenase SsuD/methylene tetrahydromethanopterin reductase-like flavin-dependent oxidoreductase (luciferase family)
MTPSLVPADPPARSLGVMFDRDRPPEQLVQAVRYCEAAGADEFWVVEDLGWAGGVSTAAAALAVTDRIRVGIGICPVPLRNPTVLAMELAFLARLRPGRLLPGVGHGVPDWIRRLGAAPRSALALLEENVYVLRELLAGRPVAIDGRELHIEQFELTHKPTVVPPLYTGVLGPKSLELSGRVADGTILVEGTGPDLLRRVREHIDRGREAAGRTDPHRIMVFCPAYVSDDDELVRTVSAPVARDFSAFLGIDEADAFLAVGSAERVADRVGTLFDAGVDSVILRPIGPADRQVEQTAATLAAVGRSA